MKLIDLRSDTVTKPNKAMLHAMMNASLGDDVFQEDPTVQKLEAMLAERSGMEAALYASSGTQTNLLGIMSHCERGDEYIVGQTAHTYLSEGGGAAVLGSIQPQPLDFEANGTLDLDKVALAIKPINDHYARTKLLCLENTTNGKVLPLEYLKQIKPFCKKHGILAHLDGARVFNATVQLHVELYDISQHFDSISICLSKGLGAPVGSVLCGTKELIKKARRWRKVLGGGMRQAGVIAAAGIYALEHNIDRLKTDHENASLLAHGLKEAGAMEINSNTTQTNMVFFKARSDYAELQNHLLQKNIIFPKQSNKLGWVRLVTHLDVTNDDIERTLLEIRKFYDLR